MSEVPRRRSGRRVALWGAAAAAVYLAVAVLSVVSGLTLGRPLYDGLPSQPYRWVKPPPERLKDNVAPSGKEEVVRLNASGTADPGSISTDDVQATVILQRIEPKEYLPDRPTDVKVTITPLDPLTVGPDPAGRYFDSNAYRIEATYPSGAPVEDGDFYVVLTYAVHSTHLLRWTGLGWELVDNPQAERSALQMYGYTKRLGVFVAAGLGEVPKEPTSPAVRIYVVAGVAATVGVGAAIFVGRRRKRAAGGGGVGR
jgi:hypothetical protein